MFSPHIFWNASFGSKEFKYRGSFSMLVVTCKYIPKIGKSSAFIIYNYTIINNSRVVKPLPKFIHLGIFILFFSVSVEL